MPLSAVQIIGRARTPWQRREDAPHQPIASPETAGIVEIDPDFRAALADVGSLRRIWLLFLFDRSHGWAAKVKPPRGGPKRGVFATRAPNRPSQIGMTNVEVDAVDEAAGLIRVRGIDLLDATPILDIKPYLPIVDAWPDAGHGWLDAYLQAGIEPRLRMPYRPPRDAPGEGSGDAASPACISPEKPSVSIEAAAPSSLTPSR